MKGWASTWTNICCIRVSGVVASVNFSSSASASASTSASGVEGRRLERLEVLRVLTPLYQLLRDEVLRDGYQVRDVRFRIYLGGELVDVRVPVAGSPEVGKDSFCG